MAARGLITILLFYSIPVEHSIPGFSPAILLLVIIISNLVMMYGLIKNNNEPEKTPGELLPESEMDERVEQPFDPDSDVTDHRPN